MYALLNRREKSRNGTFEVKANPTGHIETQSAAGRGGQVCPAGAVTGDRRCDKQHEGGRPVHVKKEGEESRQGRDRYWS